jgi:hypothetical protein
MSYDPNNENFVNLAEVVRRCSKKNFGCDECPDEVACKKWWDEVGTKSTQRKRRS